MPTEPSHNDCIELLNDPSTQNILEKFGFEYSDRGRSEFSIGRVDIVPALVRAIVTELELHPVFPACYRKQLPEAGVYIRKQGNGFALMDADKPSVWDEYIFEKPEGAARGYIRKIIDPYWLRWDRGTDLRPKSKISSWQSGKR